MATSALLARSANARVMAPPLPPAPPSWHSPLAHLTRLIDDDCDFSDRTPAHVVELEGIVWQGIAQSVTDSVDATVVKDFVQKNFAKEGKYAKYFVASYKLKLVKLTRDPSSLPPQVLGCSSSDAAC